MSPSVAFVLPGPPLDADIDLRKHVTITSGNITVTLPATSPEVDHGERADEWVEVDRPQDYPALVHGARRLPKFTLDVTVIGKGPEEPADAIVRSIEALATSRLPCVVAYGPLEAMPAHITAMSFKSVTRRPGTNEITEATVSLTFTKQSELPSAPGQPPPPVAPTPAGGAAATGAPAAAGPKQYTARAGDTLWGIAVQFYGNGSGWPRIAQASGIDDPRTLRAGQVLTIP